MKKQLKRKIEKTTVKQENAQLAYWEKSGLLGILTRCCISYGVSIEEASSRARNEGAVFARQAYCYKAFRDTRQSIKNIGELIGRKRSTVNYSIKAVENYIETDLRRFTDIYMILLMD